MNKRLTWFILAVVVQGVILAAVPAKQAYTRLTGKLITIKTAPVDPYNILSGYYVTLNHEISRPQGISKLQDDRKDAAVYVVLKEGNDQVWSAASAHASWPESVPSGCVVIKGKRRYSNIRYGIESYFIPEKARKEIERDLRENASQAKAQIKVDRFGNATLIRLLVEDRVYEY